MLKKVFLIIVITFLLVPLLNFRFSEVGAASNHVPLTPHEVNVLVVSPANTYFKGGHYLISDLARYGFNVTQHTSDVPVDYLTESKTSDLSQYDIVILHGGYFGQPPTNVTVEEVSHFANYGGVLIVIGNALFMNETSGTWWNNLFASAPVQTIEARLGVDFTGYLKNVGATDWHNNGTFTLTNSSIPGLPSSMTYIRHAYALTQYQMALSTSGASEIYDFATQDDVTTCGVTFYKNASGSVGIYIQGSYVYAVSPGTNQIRYYGLTDIAQRSSLLASLVAFGLGADINTLIKPQPLATIRLDDVGQPDFTGEETYLGASLSNLDSVCDLYNVEPSIAFIDHHDTDPDYWQTTGKNILSLLKTEYSDWEYSCHLQAKDVRTMTQSQIESLLENSKDNYNALGINLFSTIIAPGGWWSQAALDAMVSKNLYLIDLAGYYSDWWNIRVNSSVIVHDSQQMSGGAGTENFTQVNKNSLHWEYYGRRDKWALAVVNGVPCFFYHVPNFRRNEVGTYSVRTVCSNLTSEVPDVKFVPLVEAALYFGNTRMVIRNPTRIGSTIEFDVDASAVPTAAEIGKGMLWLRIDTTETIADVSIDNSAWYYFDDHTIRLPAGSAHVKVTLGTPTTPRVIETRSNVIDACWDAKRFNVSLSATSGLNVSVSLQIPNIAPFVDTEWHVFCSETEWDYMFDESSRVLQFWAISDGSMSVQAGPDFVPPHFLGVERYPESPEYNETVRVRVNVTDEETGMGPVILNYYNGSGWTNATMALEGERYTSIIPVLPYGKTVQYRVYASDDIGNWAETDTFDYTVVDTIPPDIGSVQWSSLEPSPGEEVVVSVSVSEPLFASDVEKVNLGWMPSRGMMQSSRMLLEGDVWKVTIPGQSGATLVQFFVEAYDNAGNRARSEQYNYTVKGGEAAPWLQSPLLIGIIVVVAAVSIGISIYLVKFKKPKITAVDK